MFIGVVILLAVFRKKIMGLFKREKKIDYSSMMDDGVSFDDEFDFNKSAYDDKEKYEKRLEEIDKELTSIKAEKEAVIEEFGKKKVMLIHKEKQLSLQYNTYLNNLKSVDQMISNQEQMKKELGEVK